VCTVHVGWERYRESNHSAWASWGDVFENLRDLEWRWINCGLLLWIRIKILVDTRTVIPGERVFAYAFKEVMVVLGSMVFKAKWTRTRRARNKFSVFHSCWNSSRKRRGMKGMSLLRSFLGFCWREARENGGYQSGAARRKWLLNRRNVWGGIVIVSMPWWSSGICGVGSPSFWMYQWCAYRCCSRSIWANFDFMFSFWACKDLASCRLTWILCREGTLQIRQLLHLFTCLSTYYLPSCLPTYLLKNLLIHTFIYSHSFARSLIHSDQLFIHESIRNMQQRAKQIRKYFPFSLQLHRNQS